MTEGNNGSKTRTKRSELSAEHKAALAKGREQGRVVRQYLEQLEQHKPRRGRKVTPEQIRDRIANIEKKLVEADAAGRLVLIQERMDLESLLNRSGEEDTLGQLEVEFIKVAKPYAESKGITYKAFREVGVPSKVLKEAGVSAS